MLIGIGFIAHLLNEGFAVNFCIAELEFFFDTITRSTRDYKMVFGLILGFDNPTVNSVERRFFSAGK